jgi:hypothetical protein
MIDLERYVIDFVDPTIDDFAKNPTSVRHAFLACVAAFHGVDYLAWPDDPGKLRSHLRRDEDFRIVDDVAHAFKHVATSRRPNKGLRPSDVVSRPSGAFDGATFDGSHFDAETGRVTLTNSGGINLLEAVKAAVQFMIREGIAMDLQKRSQGDALA